MHIRLSASLVALALFVPACGKKEAPPATTPPATTAATTAPATTAPATTAPATTAPAPTTTPPATTAEADATTTGEDAAPAPVEEVAAPAPAPADDAAAPAPGTTAGGDDDDEPKGEPLPATSPFHPLCAAHAKAQELSEGWQCRLGQELEGGKGAITKAAILRLTHFDIGGTDHRLLAFQADGGGWALGPVIVDTSVSGVGGVSMRGAIKEASLTLVGEAPLLVIRTFVHHYDSDMGVNAATMVEGHDLVVCSTVEGAARCATVAIDVTQEISKVEEGGETPPPEYGAVGKTTWSRTVKVGADGAVEIGASQGTLDRPPLEAAGTHALVDVLGKKVPGVAVWPE